MTQFSKTSCCLSNGQLCGKRTLSLANATPRPLAWSISHHHTCTWTHCVTLLIFGGSRFSELEINFTLPAPLTGQSRLYTWKESKKDSRCTQKECGNLWPRCQGTSLLGNVHPLCEYVAPLPGLHTNRTISVVPWYQTLGEGCPIWQYFSWSRQPTASLCVIWVSMQHPFWF